MFFGMFFGMFLALLLGLQMQADRSVAALVRERVHVPAREYRYVAVNIANWPAAIAGTAVVSDGSPVRLELLTEHELGNFVRGISYNYILQVGPRLNVDFRQPLPDKGEYDILLINDRDRASEVTLEVSAEFAPEPDVARYLSPTKRLTVILVSMLVFLAIVSWSGVRLVRAMRGGIQAGRPELK